MTTDYTKNFGLALPDFRMGPWHDLVNNDFRKIDGLLFSALSGANVAIWLHSTVYTVGANALDDTDASIWLCVVPHTSAATGTFAADRTAHPTYWTRLLTGFAPRGEWKQSTQYFPYDLAYDSARGIMALCTIKHISTATGSILDDKDNWAFLLDMSDVDTITAMAVSYSNSTSGIPKTNVQDAVDYQEAQIKALDAVNVTQGNQITAMQAVDTTQNNRLTAVEGKNTFTGVVTAPYFLSTTNITCQFGGSAGLGFYMDASNAAIRPPGNGTIYFQSQGGAINYGTIGNGAASFSGTMNVAGTLTAGAVAAGSLNATGGGIYCSGWGGNGNISVIFQNVQQSHYIYHDGTNTSFAGSTAVYAGNGRLWGSADALPMPPAGVTDMRLVYVGDRPASDTALEPYGPGVVLTASWWNGAILAIRYRQLQFLLNGAWAVTAFA
jgi:hypothetical protein